MTSESGASIYYTTDGTTPDNTKALYMSSISLSATTTIKAKAYLLGKDESAMLTVTFTKS